MKKIEKALKGHHYLVFMDFEATQFSHEMIALGAVYVTTNSKGRIKTKKEPFKIYVKAKNPIGAFVTKLTGIDENKLKAEGVSFYKAMQAFKKYVGHNFSKCSFITFGNYDMKILSSSIQYSFDVPKEIVSTIQKNYMDFAAFFNEFVKDEKNNNLSLVNACALFNVEEAGEAHNPSIDALNLANLYDAFVANPSLVKNEYQKVLQNSGNFPAPVLFAIKKLAAGENVTYKEFSEEIDKYLA